MTLRSDTLPSRVLAFPRCPTSERLHSPHPVSGEERIILDRLRWLAIRSRLAPKPDLERACFLLAGETDVSLDRFSVAFFRGLEERATRDIALYRPGTSAVCDDEAWLLRLIDAWRSGDEKAAAALVAWRIRPESRRWMRFLSAGLARALKPASV